MEKIILVEDDAKLSSLIQLYLSQHGFEVYVIADGESAVEHILEISPEIVILDLMLPGKDGLTICREIRSRFKGKILFLTASEDDMDHVAGVELGADDFIIKPIKPRVLLARLRMLLRRSEHSDEDSQDPPDNSPMPKLAKELVFGQLNISHSKRSVGLYGESVQLTTGEFELLWLLASHAEQILSRDFLYKELRGIEYDGMDRAMDTKVANLRKKLGDNASLSTRIITVRGQGYLFVAESWN